MSQLLGSKTLSAILHNNRKVQLLLLDFVTNMGPTMINIIMWGIKIKANKIS